MMPPCGVLDELLKDVEPDPISRYRLWLLFHNLHNGEEVVRKMVLELCVPDELSFVSLGEPF